MPTSKARCQSPARIGLAGWSEAARPAWQVAARGGGGGQRMAARRGGLRFGRNQLELLPAGASIDLREVGRGSGAGLSFRPEDTPADHARHAAEEHRAAGELFPYGGGPRPEAGRGSGATAADSDFRSCGGGNFPRRPGETTRRGAVCAFLSAHAAPGGAFTIPGRGGRLDDPNSSITFISRSTPRPPLVRPSRLRFAGRQNAS
jgi:hypothetical protein